MTAPVRAGDRLEGGFRKGQIGAMAWTPQGQLVAITCKRVVQEMVSETRSELASNDLLTTVAIAEGEGGPHQPHAILRPAAALGQTVFRQTGSAIRAPGRVSAICGTVIAQGSNVPLRIHGLLEVSFAEVSERAFNKLAMPPVAESELGKLVMTYEGAAVGLIVGGRGHLAVVAPLHSFVLENGLTLLASKFEIGEVALGLDELYNDLNQTPMLDLGEMPEAA